MSWSSFLTALQARYGRDVIRCHGGCPFLTRGIPDPRPTGWRAHRCCGSVLFRGHEGGNPSRSQLLGRQHRAGPGCHFSFLGLDALSDAQGLAVFEPLRAVGAVPDRRNTSAPGFDVSSTPELRRRDVLEALLQASAHGRSSERGGPRRRSPPQLGGARRAELGHPLEDRSLASRAVSSAARQPGRARSCRNPPRALFWQS